MSPFSSDYVCMFGNHKKQTMRKRYSLLDSVGVNLFYLENYPRIDKRKKLKMLPHTYAMEWSMRVTGINRLFSKDDVYELLVRLSMILETRGIVEDWFDNDRLFSYTVAGKPYVLTLQDVIGHFGLEIVNSVENFQTREHFMSNIRRGFVVESILQLTDYPFRLAGSFSDEDFNEELAGELEKGVATDTVKKAEVFAAHLIKLIPDNAFDKNERIIEKEQELAERRERMETIPVFDVLKIPLETRKKCYDIMFREDLKDEDYVFTEEDLKDRDKKENMFIPFLHLAWLFANDMMVEDEGMMWPEEAVRDFDESPFYDEDETISFYSTFEDYGMDECVPFLKGVGM